MVPESRSTFGISAQALHDQRRVVAELHVRVVIVRVGAKLLQLVEPSLGCVPDRRQVAVPQAPKPRITLTNWPKLFNCTSYQN